MCPGIWRHNELNRNINRPGGTGPVGPAMARPTFELGRIFKKIFKNTVNYLKSKVHRIIRPHLLTGKWRQIRDSGIQPAHLGQRHSKLLDLEVINISSATVFIMKNVARLSF